MRPRGLRAEGFRVAVVGASSLPGRELLAVLKERRFPIARLVQIDAGPDPDLGPELPILDLDERSPGGSIDLRLNPEIHGDEIDLAFVAVRPDTWPAFLRPESARPRLVIDLDASLGELGAEAPRIPFLDRAATEPANAPLASAIASAHPATIVLSLLLLRLAARVEVTTAVAHVFSPASHLGPRAIEELQRQTVNLLSFQNIPSAVFGAQLAFNLLPRLAGSGTQALGGLENRVRAEIGRYFAGRTPLPALRLLQAPVFYSLGVSLYVETAGMITSVEAARALGGERVRLRGPSEKAPSQVEVTGSDEVVIDSIVADPGRPNGLWIWAAADNLRLAAHNAVEIAEDFTGQKSNGGSPRSGRARRTGKAGVH